MQNSPKVAIVKGERGHKPVFEALDLIDYKKALAGFDKVVIKVNFIVDKRFETSIMTDAMTDPLVVEAIILKLKDIPVKQIYVVESDSTVTRADEAFESTGMKEMCIRNGVEYINLTSFKKKIKLNVPNAEKLKNFTVSRLVTESAIISVSSKATLGMKNMFGLLSDKDKTKYYAKGMDAVVVDINTVLKPKLTVISGFFGIEHKGSEKSKPSKTDLIIAGEDVVATDAAASRVLGFDPSNIHYLRRANEKGLGSINAKILGQQIDVIAKELLDARAKEAKIVFFSP